MVSTEYDGFELYPTHLPAESVSHDPVTLWFASFQTREVAQPLTSEFTNGAPATVPLLD